jgi:hypothetical protein
MEGYSNVKSVEERQEQHTKSDDYIEIDKTRIFILK